MLVLDFKKLENWFDCAKKLVARAVEKVWLLNENGFLSEDSTLETMIWEKSSLRNKLLKINSTSPVFSVSKQDFVDFVRARQKLSKFNISDDGKFEVNTQAKAALFLKIIDDDFVKSELTGKEYDAEKKNMIDYSS